MRGAPEWKDNVYTLLLQCVLLRVGSAEARAGRCGMLGDVVHSPRVVPSERLQRQPGHGVAETARFTGYKTKIVHSNLMISTFITCLFHVYVFLFIYSIGDKSQTVFMQYRLALRVRSATPCCGC